MTSARAAGIFLVARDPHALVSARGDRSYAEVAKIAGCSRSFLCQLSTGRQTGVAPRLAADIEDALDVDRGSLFTLTPADAELLAPYLPDPVPAGMGVPCLS